MPRAPPANGSGTAVRVGDRRHLPGGELVETPPSGTVTFLLTDIEGSTRLLERLGPVWGATLDAHHELLRSAIEGAGGQQVNTSRDGC
jgi:class 3 adenylate cyclase